MNNNALKIITKLVSAILIIAIGGFLSYKFVTSKPRAERKKPASITPVVTVANLEVKDHQTVVEAMGTVIPATQITLRSRVTGEIIKIHPDFLEGGILKKGETVAQIDDVDYEIIKKQKEALLAQCASDLKLEEGQQDIAKREWELLGADKDASALDRELALRVPQLKSKQAVYDSAKVALEKAEIDLQRTKVTAPFNSVILSADVQLGDQINSQTQLATLVGTDEYHVQISVPINKLSWIKIPKKRSEKGAMVTVVAEDGREYQGKVVKLLSNIEPNGRMARLLVAVKDPLQLKKNGKDGLLLGEYVTAKIKGKLLNNVIAVPRTAYHNNSDIWVITGDNKLKTVKTKPVWEERKSVFVRNGFKAEEKLITSELSFPVEGMNLKIFTEKKGK